jgi:glycosyltransferase involved in cell wall biosynthesis
MGELARNGLPRLTAQPLYVSGDSGRLPSVSWPHFTRKTLDRAIEIARRTGRQLKVAAKIYDEDRDYYRGSIKPLLRQTKSFVDFIGEIGGKDKDELMGNAHALLFPIDWPEPFGLVMIESLACGTPVIAWNNGSVPEVLSNGVTGFVVDTVDQAVEAVDEVARLKRVDCRRAFETRFDTARMAHDYLEVYSRMIENSASPRFSGHPPSVEMEMTICPTLTHV